MACDAHTHPSAAAEHQPPCGQLSPAPHVTVTRHAQSAAIDVFALASTRLYDEVARDDPQPFKQRLATVGHEWACHRLGREIRTGPVRAG